MAPSCIQQFGDRVHWDKLRWASPCPIQVRTPSEDCRNSCTCYRSRDGVRDPTASCMLKIASHRDVTGTGYPNKSKLKGKPLWPHHRFFALHRS